MPRWRLIRRGQSFPDEDIRAEIGAIRPDEGPIFDAQFGEALVAEADLVEDRPGEQRSEVALDDSAIGQGELNPASGEGHGSNNANQGQDTTHCNGRSKVTPRSTPLFLSPGPSFREAKCTPEILTFAVDNLTPDYSRKVPSRQRLRNFMVRRGMVVNRVVAVDSERIQVTEEPNRAGASASVPWPLPPGAIPAAHPPPFNPWPMNRFHPYFLTKQRGLFVDPLQNRGVRINCDYQGRIQSTIVGALPSHSGTKGGVVIDQARLTKDRNAHPLSKTSSFLLYWHRIDPQTPLLMTPSNAWK